MATRRPRILGNDDVMMDDGGGATDEHGESR